MLFEDKKNVPNKSTIIFFLILFLSLFIKSFPMYIQSFDADYFSISENLKQKLGLLYPSKEEYINSPEIIKINTDTISADQDHSIKLKLPYKTGDLGTDIMELLYVKKSGKLFSIKNYNVTYFLNEKNVIHTIYPNMFPDDIEDSIENDVDCNYTILDNKYKLEFHLFKQYEKIVFCSYVILGIDTENNIKRIQYDDKNLYESDIVNNFIRGEEYFSNDFIFLDLYKIEQMFFDKIYFAFLVKPKDNKKDNLLLLFYEIKLIINEDFELNLEYVLNLGNILNKELNTVKIKKIGLYEDYKFILLSSDKNNYNGNTFIIFNSSNNKVIPLEEIFDLNNLKNNLNIKNTNIIDFLLYNKTFCFLTEDKGLIIYDMKQEKKIQLVFNNNLEFTSGKKLEIFRNPFYDKIYLGVLFNNKEMAGNEIYMEILLDEIKNKNDNIIETRINKVITASKSRNFFYLGFINDFFSYFYDDINKEFFIYRNGLLNIVPYVTYKLNLTEQKNTEILKKENISELIPIYNKKENKFNFLFIGNKYYIILKNLTLANHNLNCTFHDTGNYNLTFILKGEVCANSLKKAEEGLYVSCHKIIKYNFHVYSKYKGKRILIFISILFIIILLASILFICYSINTGCFGKYRNNKSVKINKILFSSRLETEENLKKYSYKKQKDN